MTHLGARISALLDGQLGPEEEERAWAHVHGCHLCRDRVEHEGWVKTRLMGLSLGDDSAPTGLKGALGDPTACADRVAGTVAEPRRYGLAVLGGGAVGAAFLGVIALGVVPGSGQASDRRAPVLNVTTPSSRAPAGPTPSVTPSATPVTLGLHQGRAGVSGVRIEP